MTQPRPNRVDVDSGAEKMGGGRVPQGILILLMICRQQRFAIGIIRSVAWKLKLSATCGEVTL
jgi:hypothetical protein